MTAKYHLASAASFGLLSVVLGAFGAHALKARLSADMLAVYQTAIEYQVYHALAMLAVAVMLLLRTNRLSDAFYLQLKRANISFAIGIIVFSGSLYALSLSELIFTRKLSWLGAITPFGGMSFILGWFFLILASRHCSNTQDNTHSQHSVDSNSA